MELTENARRLRRIDYLEKRLARELKRREANPIPLRAGIWLDANEVRDLIQSDLPENIKDKARQALRSAVKEVERQLTYREESLERMKQEILSLKA